MIHERNTFLVVAIVIAGYIALLALWVLHRYRIGGDSHSNASDIRIRREIDRHKGE